MGKFIVRNVIDKPETWEFNGSSMYTYTVQGSFNGGDDDIFKINVKTVANAPKIGDEFEANAQYTPQGNKLKKISSFGSNNSGGSNSAKSPNTAFKSDPAIQSAIIRQNALTNAVAYCIAKAQLMEKKDALKYMEGAKIVEVASYFAKFSEGKIVFITPPKESEQVSENDMHDLAQEVFNENEEGNPEEGKTEDIPF